MLLKLIYFIFAKHNFYLNYIIDYPPQPRKIPGYVAGDDNDTPPRTTAARAIHFNTIFSQGPIQRRGWRVDVWRLRPRKVHGTVDLRVPHRTRLLAIRPRRVNTILFASDCTDIILSYKKIHSQ